MGSQPRETLNSLQRDLPEGMVVDAAWLERHGVSRQLRHKYVMNGWLVSPARGVYRRPRADPARSNSPPDKKNEALPWQLLVVSLNSLLNLPVSVGARTALEIQGFSHYLTPGGPREAHLYTDHTLPRWVSQVPVDTKLVFHNAKKLFESGGIPAGKGNRADPARLKNPADPARLDPRADSAQSNINASFIQQPLGTWNLPLILSTPERAMLELLDEVPAHETFHQADVLMEGLRNLSPRRLQPLLTDCKSVKVKRLFLMFAERHNHAWLQKLDRSGIDLGKGKRMLVRGGKLDTKYNITVPKDFNAGV
jgi:hypothetical protein